MLKIKKFFLKFELSKILLFTFFITIIYIYIILFFLIFDQKYSKTFFNKNFNIFFIETNKTRKFLTYKQMCSIESAALHNSNSNVYIYSLNAGINQQLLRKYKNIRYILTNEDSVYENTPLYQWWTSKRKLIEKSKFKIHDLSDTIRIALIYKYGGFYSDLDNILIKNLEPLHNLNAIACSSNGKNYKTNNAVFIFKKSNKFLYYVMEMLVKSYKINIWAYNGPNLIERSLKTYCKSNDIYKELLFTENSEFKKLNSTKISDACDMVLLNEKYFYPIHWSNSRVLFKKNSIVDISTFLNSYGVHFYSSHSQYIDIRLNDNSIYEFFVSQNCPLIYSYLQQKIIDKI